MGTRLDQARQEFSEPAVPLAVRQERSERVKQAARELGFSLVGIAEALPLEKEINAFGEWLSLGYHASMGYMERNRDKRRDVSVILPGARSVVVVAQNYFKNSASAAPISLSPQNESPAPELTPISGKISRYAWGDDYHEVLPPKLEALAGEIRRMMPGTLTKVYTDTGAVLEKQWAVRAGIGWQGKHSNIISREIGSWFFLGVVIATAEFAYDTPLPDYCGDCDACLRACPTQAIAQPRVVDARKCIPFWTIETKPEVEIPIPIAQNLDGWIFGCDTCQDVCPWNRFQTVSDEVRFEPRFAVEKGAMRVPLERIDFMEQEEFSRLFRKSPVKRAKISGLRRNARALRMSALPEDERRLPQERDQEPVERTKKNLL